MNEWTVGHSRDGYSLVIQEAPAWAYAVEWAAFKVDAALGHVLCGGGSPDWLWNLPIGWPQRDDDGLLVNSAAARLFDLCNRLFNMAWRHQTLERRLPIPDELGLDLWPESAEWAPDDGDDPDERVIADVTSRWDIYRDRQGNPVTITPEQCAAIQHAARVWLEVARAEGYVAAPAIEAAVRAVNLAVVQKSCLMGRMLYDGKPPLDTAPPVVNAAPAYHLVEGGTP